MNKNPNIRLYTKTVYFKQSITYNKKLTKIPSINLSKSILLIIKKKIK